MERIFLESVWAGYEIMRWAAHANAIIIRAIPTRKGHVVYYRART